MRIFLLIILLIIPLTIMMGEEKWGRDPFQPPEEENVPPPEIQQPEEVLSTDELVLYGTLVGAEGAVAIINGKIVKEGEKIGKYQVLSIKRKKVILDKEGKRYVLYLMSH